MKAEEYNIVLPDNIVRIINERGMKQGVVAERAGYSKQQLSDMLNGRRIIKPCDALAIANTLGVTMNELFKSPKNRDRRKRK